MADYARFKVLAERGFAAQGRAKPNGQFATLRTVTATGDAWAPTLTPAYTTIEVFDAGRKQRYADGALVVEDDATIFTSPPAGVAIKTGDKIALGIKSEDATEESPWRNVQGAEPFAPNGTVVFYELKLAF